MRVKRKINKIMDKMIEEQFNMETNEKHIFSEKYEINKQRLLNSKDNVIRTEGKYGRIKKIYRMTAMAATMVLCCSVGAFAVSEIMKTYEMYVKDDGEYKVDLVVEPGKDNEAGTQKRYAKLNISYLPQGLTEVDGSAGTKYYFEDNASMAGIVFQLYDVNEIQDKTVLENFNVVSADTIDINGNKAIFIKEDDKIEDAAGTDKYNKRMFIYFKEQNYLVKYQSCSIISDEEMLMIGNGISIEKTDEANATLCSQWEYGSDTAGESNVVDELPEAEIYIHNSGDEFTDKVLIGKEKSEGNLTYKVNEITISDSFDQIGGGILREECYAFLDDAGKLMPNKIVYIKNGDGIHSLSDILTEETVQQKVVWVTMTIRNDSYKDYEDFMPTIRLAKMKKENGNYKLVQYTRDIECDRVSSTADIIQNDAIYYDYVDKYGVKGVDILKAGEEKTIHAAFCINECDIPYLYVNTSRIDGTTYFYEESKGQAQSVFNYIKVQD